MSGVLEFVITALVAVVVMVFSFATTAAIIVPFTGVVVRLRANFAPRGLALSDVEAEGGAPPVGPVRGIWGMFVRVRRLEGAKGLFKGTVPIFGSSVLMSLATVIFIGSTSSLTPKGTYAMPDANGLRMTLFSIAMTFISVPLNVLINRSIVTPHLLPWSPKAAAALVLTPYERARPWVMFKSPGLLAATTLQVLWVTVVATSVRALVVEELANGIFKDPSSSRDGPFARIRTGRLFIFLAFQAASTLILCPLEVLAVRLSVQRQNAPGEISTGEIPSEYAAKDEDVIGLRSEEEPYAGLVDAVKSIYAEEGVGALYSAWIITMFGALVGTFM